MAVPTLAASGQTPQSLAAAAAYRAAPAAPGGGAEAAMRAADDFATMVRGGEAEAARAVAGTGDPHALVTALSEARLAVEATVAVRDRVVEAYQELLRMPV